MFIERGPEALRVRRKRLAAAEPEGFEYRQQVVDEPYLKGALYTDELMRVVNQPGWTLAQIAGWAREWVEDLRACAAANSGLLPASYLDRVPFNLIRGPGGGLCAFDQEYLAATPLELEFVVFRGLWGSLAHAGSCAAPAAELGRCHLAETAFAVMRLLGIEVPGDGQARLAAREAEFQEAVTGVPREQAALTLTTARMRVRSLPGHRRGDGPPGRANLQLFWRAPGQNFNEPASAVTPLDITGRRQDLQLWIPPGLTPLAQLRLDPSDRRGAARLFTLRLLDAQERPLWVWDGRAASLRPDATHIFVADDGNTALLVFLDQDPRLLLPIPDGLLAGSVLGYGGILNIELAWLDDVGSFFEDEILNH
jgi:hypothetical protein